MEKPIFSRDEIDLFRQWFDAVDDLTASHLEPRDYALAKRLYEASGMRVPYRIKARSQAALSSPTVEG